MKKSVTAYYHCDINTSLSVEHGLNDYKPDHPLTLNITKSPHNFINIAPPKSLYLQVNNIKYEKIHTIPYS